MFGFEILGALIRFVFINIFTSNKKSFKEIFTSFRFNEVTASQDFGEDRKNYNVGLIFTGISIIAVVIYDNYFSR